MNFFLRFSLLMSLGFVSCNQLPTYDGPVNSADTAIFQTALNNTRAVNRICSNANAGSGYAVGTAVANAVAALNQNPKLEQAALVQVWDLVQNNRFSHAGLDGSMPWQRATRAGYLGTTIGETIAGIGVSASAQDVLNDWLASDTGHCNAVMDGGFTQFGVARLPGSAANTYQSYWVMVLGKPNS